MAAARPASVLGVAGDDRQAQEDVAGHRASGGDGVVGDVVGPHDELLVVPARVVEASGGLVPEQLHHLIAQYGGLPEPLYVQGDLVQGDETVYKESVVLQVGVELGIAIPVGAKQPAPGPELSQEEYGVSLRYPSVVGAGEDGSGLRKGAEHHAVPRSQYLVVPGRADAPAPGGQQLSLGAPEHGIALLLRSAQRLLVQGVVAHAEDGVALEIAVGGWRRSTC